MLFGRRLKKRFIGVLGLAVLGVVVHFLDSQRPRSNNLFDGVDERPSEPDYFAVNSQYRSYNHDGQLEHSIRADRLLHFPDSRETRLEQPELSTYDVDGKALWNARSDKGLVEGDGNHFQLNQNVIVWKGTSRQPEDKTLTPVRLTTDLLNIDLEKEQAYTDKTVLLEAERGDMQGKGLQANLKTSQIYLLEDVRGLYVQ